jgi:hypothetical protein
MTISTTTLKNAAFAIECDLWTDPATGANYLAKDGAILRRWEPETSSADSFELASDLNMTLRFDSIVYRSVAVYGDGERCMEYWSSNDKSQAMRIAVLRAASYIGESLCQ